MSTYLIGVRTDLQAFLDRLAPLSPVTISLRFDGSAFWVDALSPADITAAPLESIAIDPEGLEWLADTIQETGCVVLDQSPVENDQSIMAHLIVVCGTYEAYCEHSEPFGSMAGRAMGFFFNKGYRSRYVTV